MRYLIRQKVFSIADSFTIKDEWGNDIFIVRSQVFSLGKKLRIFDLAGNELCYIEQKLFKFLPEYDIYIAGELNANIKKKFSLFRNDFVIDSAEGEYQADGNVFAREFTIFKDGMPIARISKEFFTFTDTYGVEVDDDQDQVKALALAIVIDMVCHDHDN